VGLVASRKRGHGVLGELRSDGLDPELLERIDTPAGLNIGARTAPEIALSILARIVEVRRREATAPVAATRAIDPVCGMEVVVMADTPAVVHAGETFHFCGAGCKAAFEREHAVPD
jgi:xanthine dehydrogenase accessory factor